MKEKSAKIQIKEKIEQIEKIRSDVESNEELVKLRKAYMEKRDKLYKEVDEQIKSLHDQIDKLEIEEAIERRKKEDNIPKDIREFIFNASRGVDWGSKGLVAKWWSKDNRFVIITQPGENAWCCRGETNYYPTKHYICDLSKYDKEHCGFSVFQDTVIEEASGRLSKEQLQKWQKKIADLA